MPTPNKTLIDLENKFWQSMVDQDTDAALQMLSEPALMVSPHGAIKFDHAGYRKMAEQGSMVVTAFKLSDMEVVFPNEATAILSYRVKQEVASKGDGKSSEQEMNDTSTWVQKGTRWQCVMHTETPAAAGH
ncbi:MAG: nuclear transport factor 2 family protein [Rhizobacter sp.]|nr:nuclear transport factor 2 family protein [Rhizobacter sp.]